MALGNSIALHKHGELFVQQYLRYYSSLRILLVLLGVGWLLLLPLEKVNQRTYIDENALLPGQVHTYFGGSEELVLNAYREEISSWGDWTLAEHVILHDYANNPELHIKSKI
ncbi:GPI transamidase component GAA1 [Neolecta irregularis DAH-3]|uniref:GPI transamidase component GAA1 n=1 Tax=Neolecta irregularis (strain DAH-3) TaxID=1198029 RepID=A0A1U7LJJ4_NEOID|nr:GPI transamidase component GAA1 [Neolecta irregularis DAH-3]|eukprot:OLL22817.1 GPI transamidase component GAA1 [Neolecta irregularis DAH-3]